MNIKNKNFLMLLILGITSMGAFADEMQIPYPMPSTSSLSIKNYTIENGHAKLCSGAAILTKEVDVLPVQSQPPSPWQGKMQFQPTYNVCFPDVSVAQLQAAIPESYNAASNNVPFFVGGQPVFTMTNLSATSWKGQYFYYTGPDGKQVQYNFVGCSAGGSNQIFCCFGTGSGDCEGFR